MVSLFRAEAQSTSVLLFDKTEPDHPNDDQVDRNDVVEQTRHDQNENAREERDNGREVADAESHGSLRLGQNHHPSIREKSATARVASRISFSSLSRFSRTALSSAFTVTFSKNASTTGRSFAITRIAPSKSSAATALAASAFAMSIASARARSSASA